MAKLKLCTVPDGLQSSGVRDRTLVMVTTGLAREANAVLGSRVMDQWQQGMAAPELIRAWFGTADTLRRAQGDVIAAFGLDPTECAYRIVAAGPHWRLRDYGTDGASPSLLIVAAPIKRPYIWDLTPSASAIRYCLQNGLHVHLLEWLPASQSIGNNGLDEYALAISDCIAKIAADQGNKPFLIGHSLGGTLAAIYGAWAPASLRGLVLLGAPLCFEPGQSRFRDALVSLVPPTFSEVSTFPGSLLSQMSALAAPQTFIWSRLMDAALSLADHHALEIHGRIERWALDEVALPGKLVHQIIEWLYRENRLCRGTLTVGGMRIDPASLSVPALAIVNAADEVAPLASIKPFTDAVAAKSLRIIEYPGEVGVCLQHLGILVGRQARTKVWPDIISWLNLHG
jgi:polyhydroxyalkanoate synthase subunit PhaC